MAAMGGMTMPGGWTLSMAWMRMPWQSWLGVAAAFVGMWTAMMAAMMLPALVPMLGRYRSAVAGAARRDAFTARVAAGYFGVWLALGAAVFAAGALLAALALRHPALTRGEPLAAGVALLLAGVFQCSRSKAHWLACCRDAPAQANALATHGDTAWRHGLRLGLDCVACCAGLTVALIVAGSMDLRVMALAAAAITAERLAPQGERVARAIGLLLVIAGLWAAVRAIGS